MKFVDNVLCCQVENVLGVAAQYARAGWELVLLSGDFEVDWNNTQGRSPA